MKNLKETQERDGARRRTNGSGAVKGGGAALNLEDWQTGEGGGGVEYDLICLSHLRWDFVYQRPQHLLSRCARDRRVFFFEEPIYGDDYRLDVKLSDDGVFVAVPHLPEGVSGVAAEALQQALLNRMMAEHGVANYVLWYYTPMPVAWARHLRPLAVVYDCMDELSAFKGAPPALKEREAELFRRADLVFTGGQSLYEAKRGKHPQIYAFPSSIDRAHFAQARGDVAEPADQAGIPRPRMGFFGVVDERLDIELLDGLALARPDWQFVIVGPVVKIDPASLPRHANLHYLGGKSYKELPAYIAGWDVAALLFARNEHTRYISPTKTPEYLAAGKPVVSTTIRDVVRPYGELGLVHIADTVEEFVRAAEPHMTGEASGRAEWLERVDDFLAENSWDKTWARMSELIEAVAARRLGASYGRFMVVGQPDAARPTTGALAAAAGD
ncbi:MAG TPA: glycosyltransferase family 1 protein [Pyrinomonadaceae bacterium]|nr:glycosyltransferase family 1 protein [Pyrinomonadaceae bacterium]